MIEMNIESRIYRLRGLTPILGTLPASRTLRTEFVASKAPTPELRDEEAENPFNLDDKGLTVFCRDDRDRLCLMGYQIKGFFKEALTALKLQSGVAAHRSKVDTLLFVEPRYIPLQVNGQPTREESEILERPLRAMTMQGERTTLAASEQLNDPWEIEIEISLLPSAGTAKSKPLTWDVVELALSYGAYHGMGQWRNAGYGRFTFQRVDDEGAAS
jgi:hypothetical protein